MITVSFYHDTRSNKMNGPVKIAITKDRKTAYIGSGVSVAPGEWTGEEVVGNRCANIYNIKLQNLIAQVRTMVLADELNGLLSGMTAKEVRDRVMVRVDPDAHQEKVLRQQKREQKAEAAKCLEQVFIDFIAGKEKASTRDVYRHTFNKVCAYVSFLSGDESGEKPSTFGGLRWEDVDRRWLEGFDVFLARTSPSVNARDIHFRNLRAVFNRAIDDGVTSCYPFRGFKHKTEETRKRALSLEELRELWFFEADPWEEWYRDIFKLSFLLRGINMVDLFNLKKSDYRAGRIVYRRSKTGRLYDVEVLPEAKEIIDRLRPKPGVVVKAGERKKESKQMTFALAAYRRKHPEAAEAREARIRKKEAQGDLLLGFYQRYDTHKSLTHRVNLVLKGLNGGKWSDLTMYAARHSVATLMADMDVPNEVIAEALGHSYGNSTTAIYIKPNQRKVDDAMRRLVGEIVTPSGSPCLGGGGG